MAKRYWLIKSEPSDFSFNDLKKAEDQTTSWGGVRNYQARNFIRDEMNLGDGVLFYHSNANPTAIMGVCKVTKEAYADPTQFDPDDNHYYPSSNEDEPVWFAVDIKFVEEFVKPVTLAEIKLNSKLKNMRLVQKGNRLSVMPVIEEEWNEVLRMGRMKTG